MNGVLSTEKINEIRNNVDIVEIISSYIPLTTKGKNFFGVCPFHSDHSPSMSVSKEKQIYTCFSCGASGNVFNFLMDYKNISFVEAVKICADKVGININIGKQIENNKFKEIYDIYNLAQKYYQNNLNTIAGQAAKEYLKSRSFNDEIIKYFGVGLSLNKRDELTNLLINKSYNLKLLEKTGLIGKTNNGYNDLYINRIMFPLYDLNGKIIGYSGRIYNTESNSKYINTKETELFKKGELLYNYHIAKENREKRLIVVEGFMDVIRLYTIGITKVVATMGTAITKNQALLMRKLSDEIILMFDGDAAGEKATNSCIEELEKIGIMPKIIRLENNMDPDEYILKFGKNKMLDKINNPINVMDYKMNYYKKGKNLKNEFELTDYINNSLNELSKIEDDIYVELTLKKLSDESGLSVEYLKNKIKKQEKTIIKNIESEKINGYEIAERNLLYYMMCDSEVIKLCLKEKPVFINNEYKKLAKDIIMYYNNAHDVSLADIVSYFRDDEKILVIKKLLKLNLKSVDINIIKGYIKRLKDRQKENEIKNKITEIIINDDQEIKLKKLQEMIDLKKEDD